MPTIGIGVVAGGSIPDLHSFIGGAGGNPLAIVGPGDGIDSIRMTMIDIGMVTGGSPCVASEEARW